MFCMLRSTDDSGSVSDTAETHGHIGTIFPFHMWALVTSGGVYIPLSNPNQLQKHCQRSYIYQLYAHI